jgi:mRNA interferase RelE/StbE
VKTQGRKPMAAKNDLLQLKVPDRVGERLRRMHPLLKRKIKESLRIILSNPEEGKFLKKELAGLQSFRVGRFRIIYQVKDKVVEIVAVGPRQRIYEETYQLIIGETQRKS